MTRTPKTLAAMFSVGSSPHVVQQPMKDLIEELDPARHQFRPLPMIQPRGPLSFKGREHAEDP